MEIKWISSWGDEFDNEKDARLHAKEQMDWDSYKHELQYIISLNRLLEWAHNQDSFWDEFQDEITAAEEEFFSDNYYIE